MLDLLKCSEVKCRLPQSVITTGETVSSTCHLRKVKTMKRNVRPVRILSTLLLVAVVNVYVFAAGAVVPKNTDSANGRALLGKLVTMSNRPVLVNGVEAITGSIVLSGAQVITPSTSVATVQLESVGTVTVAPKSNVMLSFDSKSVTVRVATGDATVITAEGVKGTVIGPNGEPSNAPRPVPTDADTARNWGIAGVAVGGAALVWAILAWNRANDARDDADAANAALASLRACLAGQTTSPIKLCTSF